MATHRFQIQGKVGKEGKKYVVQLRLGSNTVAGYSKTQHGALRDALKSLGYWYGNEGVEYRRARRRMRVAKR